jgi:hypothetical protein
VYFESLVLPSLDAASARAVEEGLLKSLRYWLRSDHLSRNPKIVRYATRAMPQKKLK